MLLPTTVKFANEGVERALVSLKDGNDQEKEIYIRLLRILDKLKRNAFSGSQIPKKLIPKEYIILYRITNLWKYNLPFGWRLLYAIEKEDIIIFSIILEFLPHKEYEKRFKY